MNNIARNILLAVAIPLSHRAMRLRKSPTATTTR